MTLADLRLPNADTGAVGGSDDGLRADRPRRRAFSAEYKLAILDEYDRADGPGANAALLRREVLYSLHIEWRRARNAGALVGLTPLTGTPSRSSEEAEIERLRR